MSEDLVDRIYEAAIIPELWTGVLDELNTVGNGFATFLFGMTNQAERWIGSRNGGYAAEYMAENWPQRTDRAARLIGAQHAGFLGDLDVYSPEEWSSEPVLVEFMHPRGIGWGAATAISVPNGDLLMFDVERRIEAGPVDTTTIARLDELRPHLARSGMLAARFAFERARAVATALESIGLPAAVLGHRGAIVAANELFSPLIPSVVMDRRERTTLANSSADALFAAALNNQAESVCSVAIPAIETSPATIAHLIPVRRQARDVFSLAKFILVLTPVVPADVPAAELLQGLFDLTAAEARVARRIAQSETVETIAQKLGVSRETVRTQLKAVLSKTGTARQTDLALLLTGGRVL